MNKYFVANWKNYIIDIEKAKDLIKNYSNNSNIKIVVCPHNTLLSATKDFLQSKNFYLGSQGISDYGDKTRTGYTNAKDLKHIGIEFVIVGHAEQRALGETDEDIKRKVSVLVKENLSPIICLGTALDYESKIIEKQILIATENLSKEEIKKCIFAYEPIKYIGSDKSLDVASIKKIVTLIKDVIDKKFGEVSVPILYGGSVDESSIEGIFKDGMVDGVLVGRASVNKDIFNKMIEKIC